MHLARRPAISLLISAHWNSKLKFRNSLERERTRFANLLKEDAATGKQLDDIESQLKVAKEQLGLSQRQLDQQKAAISTQNRSVLSEQTPLSKRKAQIDDQLSRT